MSRFGSSCALWIASCNSSSRVRVAGEDAGKGAGAGAEAGAGANAGAPRGSEAPGNLSLRVVVLAFTVPGRRVGPRALGLTRGQGAAASLSTRRGFCRSLDGTPPRMRSRSIALVPETGRPRRRSCCRSSETVSSSNLRVSSSSLCAGGEGLESPGEEGFIRGCGLCEFFSSHRGGPGGLKVDPSAWRSALGPCLRSGGMYR